METSIRRRDWLLTLSALSLASRGLAQSSDFPSRPIRIVVPWATSTPADVVARIVSDKLAARLGQAVFVENKPGAAGTVAIPEVMRQPADGYTLYMLASASLVAPVLFPQSAVDYSKAFDAVAQLEWSYNVLVTSAQKPYRSTKDLIDELRRRPSDLTFASGGNGSPPHLAGELLNLEATVEGRHVPYQQVTQAVTDLIAGVTDYMFLGAAVAVQLIKAGRLRALAVTSSARVPALPDVPTMAESGYPGFIIRPVDGLLARKGTPVPVIQRLNAELQAVLALQQVKDSLANVGMEVAMSTPQEFGQLVAVESERWLGLARRARIKVD